MRGCRTSQTGILGSVGEGVLTMIDGDTSVDLRVSVTDALTAGLMD